MSPPRAAHVDKVSNLETKSKKRVSTTIRVSAKLQTVTEERRGLKLLSEGGAAVQFEIDDLNEVCFYFIFFNNCISIFKTFYFYC